MKIVIFGGTGFIGRALIQASFFEKHEVYIVSRHPEKYNLSLNENFYLIKADDQLEQNLLPLFSGTYGIINLAGEPLSNWPWSKVQKQRILISRLRIATLISHLTNKATAAPAFIIQSSAIGFYGFKQPGKITENNAAGSNFLAEVCDKWEAALNVKHEETRVVFLRTGLVLGKEGGLLEILKVPFYLFVGGPLGSGKQMVSWIHLEDEIRAIGFLIENSDVKGPFNLVAPNPVSMKKLMKTIGKNMKRYSWFPVPSFLLRLVLGATFANELILKGQDVIPEKLLQNHFKFKFNDVEEALADLI